MNTTNQRLEAAKLARQLGATNTLSIINDESKNSSLQLILTTADKEVGRDKLMSTILNSDQPQWALGALRYLSDLENYKEQLIEKANLISFCQQQNQDFVKGIDVPKIKYFKMNLECGVGYMANFTMYYFTPPFNNQWNKSTEYSGDPIPVCQSQTKECSFFSIPDKPLQTGDIVMMVVGVVAGPDAPTNIWFTYDPDSECTATIDCTGSTLIPSFEWSIKMECKQLHEQ